MGPRIYPSYQDTNTTATGTFIISLDGSFTPLNTRNVTLRNDTDNVYEEFYNYSKVTNKIYANLVANKVYTLFLRIVPSTTVKGFQLYKTDYTINDIGGNNGIITNFITGATNTTLTNFPYTFTATTLSNSYKFEYNATCYLNPVLPTPTPLPTTTPIPTIEPTYTPTPTPT